MSDWMQFKLPPLLLWVAVIMFGLAIPFPPPGVTQPDFRYLCVVVIVMALGLISFMRYVRLIK